MPPVVVLIVCKVIAAGAPDQNSDMTRWANLQWDTTDAVMHCRRLEVQMTDPAADQGKGEPQPFNENRCRQSASMLGPNWDYANSGSKYRFWKFACPVPIINDITKEIIGFKIPECPTDVGVVCDVDSAI